MTVSPTSLVPELTVPLKAPEKATELTSCLWFRVAICAYQRLWGIFNRGVAFPDPYQYSEFHDALNFVVRHFPLAIEGGDRAQIEGWVKNIAKLSEVYTERYLDALLESREFKLPNAYSLAANASNNDKRDFAWLVIQYCISEGYIEFGAPVNQINIRAKARKRRQQIARTRVLLLNGRPCSEENYLSCVVSMIDHLMHLGVPSESDVLRPEVASHG